MVDISIAAADVQLVSNSALTKVQFGEVVTAGESVYLKISDSKHWLADCDDSAEAAISGVVMIGAGADGYGYIADTVGQTVDIGATLTVGEVYVVSDTAGGIMPIGDLTTGQYISLVGIASTTSNLLLLKNATSIQAP